MYSNRMFYRLSRRSYKRLVTVLFATSHCFKNDQSLLHKRQVIVDPFLLEVTNLDNQYFRSGYVSIGIILLKPPQDRRGSRDLDPDLNVDIKKTVVSRF